MLDNVLSLIVLLSPAVFIATAVASWFQAGLRPRLVQKFSTIATYTGIAIGALGGLLVINYGFIESALFGIEGIGFSIRLDAVSVIMLNLITLLGFIIIKFSKNYLDGDKRQGTFMGRMAAAIASVQLLVLAGNLGLLLFAWILTSISLHRLLVFYRSRRGAVIAAKKKFILARLGDLSLLAAIVLLYNQFGSGNLEIIFTAIKTGAPNDLGFMAVEGPALFLALAALLKSAQFPTHGWLIEVMETPTPVSALLHAGLLNAGPFLIIRMAYVMEVSTVASISLIAIGGFTALFGSVVYLTQTSVKTALGYSSVAHMGFSLMVCGLGVYPAAMLHLMAHSFYKAHSFLSSGSVIDTLKTSRIKGLTRSGSPLKIGLGIAMAFGLYFVFLALWGVDISKDISLLLIGAIIIMGLSRIFTSAVDSEKNPLLVGYASLLALMVTVAFFSLEAGTEYLLASQIPERLNPGWGEITAAGVVLGTFALAIFIQIISPKISQTQSYRAMAIHIRNGFYANALFDTVVGALHIHTKNKKEETLVKNAKTNGDYVRQKRDPVYSQPEFQEFIPVQPNNSKQH